MITFGIGNWFMHVHQHILYDINTNFLTLASTRLPQFSHNNRRLHRNTTTITNTQHTTNQAIYVEFVVPSLQYQHKRGKVDETGLERRTIKALQNRLQLFALGRRAELLHHLRQTRHTHHARIVFFV